MIKSPKQKGSSFERVVAKRLSLWLSELKRDDLLRRTQGSGAAATVLAKTGNLAESNLTAEAGDIGAAYPEANWFVDYFFIECKRYRTLDLHKLFYEQSGLMTPIWKTARHQALEAGKCPMLVFKEDRRKPLIVVPTPTARTFDRFCLRKGMRSPRVLDVRDLQVSFLDFAEFCLRVNPSHAKRVFTHEAANHE